MARRKPNTEPTYGELVIEGLRQAIEIARGERPPARIHRVALTARDVDVEPPPKYEAGPIRSIRERLKRSQALFAAALNVSTATVRGWEQGLRIPDGPSRRLLEIAERHPDTLLATLR
jgi:DNA-binding transcriptional regulator YiaG